MRLRSVYFFSILLISTIFSFGQKPVIDDKVYNEWPSLGTLSLSNDGNYVFYKIFTGPFLSRKVNKIVLKAVHSGWEMEIHTASQMMFTNDSRMALFKAGDSLGMITLGTFRVETISHVRSFKLLTKGSEEWLVYQSDTGDNELRVKNLMTGIQKSFFCVKDYLPGNDCGILHIHGQGNAAPYSDSLIWVNFNDWSEITIWKGTNATNMVFDANTAQLAFLGERKVGSHFENSLWYYKAGGNRTSLLLDSRSLDFGTEFQFGNIQKFSKDGEKLFFDLLKKNDLKDTVRTDVQVDIWNYSDTKLQSQRMKELNQTHHFLAVISVENRKVVQLERENEYIIQGNGNYAMVLHGRNVGEGEKSWNPAAKEPAEVVSYDDGSRTKMKGPANLAFSFSPGGKYVIFYNPKEKDYFSYEPSSGLLINISRRCNTKWTIYGNDLPDSGRAVYGPAGWLRNDSGVFLYDQNDIWLIDPSAKRLPINLTNGYGHTHNIVFRFATNPQIAYGLHDTALLAAFNRVNKDNGFYRTIIGQKGDPKLLTMGPYIFYIPMHLGQLNGSIPLKAVNSNTYVIRRESAEESPNYYSTNDFINFNALSNIYPEKKYNWLTTELLTWKAFDGTQDQGILYKPENFDPEKRYPVILNYYENVSDGLNGYLEPQFSDGDLNIPWFVSNGYLVFSPDIHFRNGEPGSCVMNDVLSGAQYLAKKPFVNAKRMGLEGISLGGYETNYIVTHTHFFAAACSASGVSDCISFYGSLTGSGASEEEQVEQGQTRIGATIWQRPDLYIKNSPIFYVDHVTTPLLIMATTIDGSVPFAQNIEFFTALRRLGKKAWMLQYGDCEHGVWGRSAIDFTARLVQFFNHYLKDDPSPEWMTKGN
jgi:dienelactone hydrolase